MYSSTAEYQCHGSICTVIGMLVWFLGMSLDGVRVIYTRHTAQWYGAQYEFQRRMTLY